MPLPPVRVLLADDHALVRAGIRTLVEQIPEVEVVGEAGDGRRACDLARDLQPNLVIMDIAMSELNGLEATARLTREQPGLKVLILSMHANEEYVLQALRAGAAGYLLKDAAVIELQLAVRAAMRGETWLSPAISRSVIDQYLNQLKGQAGGQPALTPRQREILQLIAEGKNTKEVAYVLGVSAKTVETHRALLMERLNIYDIPGLVRYAMRTGLVVGEPGLGGAGAIGDSK